MSASEPIEGSAPTEPLQPAVMAEPMDALGFDALEERLREFRGSLGLGDASPSNAAPLRAVPVRAPRPIQRRVREARPEVVLRTPRIGWDLVGLAAAWAGLIGLLIGLVAGPLG